MVRGASASSVSRLQEGIFVTVSRVLINEKASTEHTNIEILVHY